MELKVINSNENEMKEFKSLEEFDLFYQKRKDELNNKTTQWLNKTFSIITNDGERYRITKIGTRDKNGKRQPGEIYLKKVVKKHEEVPINGNDRENLVELSDLNNLRDELMGEIDSIKTVNHKLISRIKDLTDKNNKLQSQIEEMSKVLKQIVQAYNSSI